ncbi:MAG: hypothetical protein AAGF50_14290 [Pseudomonadota bacterium]
MKKDDLIRELRNQSATWHAAALVYAILVGALVVTGIAITG